MTRRIDILGIEVDALTHDALFERIEKAIHNNELCVVANHNLHSIYLYHHNDEMRRFYQNADAIVVDGMSIIFLSRLQGLPLNRHHRLTWTDQLRPLISLAADRGWRVFFLGSMPGVGDQAGNVLRSSSPQLQYQSRHGYFDARQDSDENRQIIESINAFRPHILLVGMGMPRQEKWLLENIGQLDCNVACNVGACMDFVAGSKPLPPRWLGQFGLEWAYRLAREPARLFRRYLVEPWSLLRYLFRR